MMERYGTDGMIVRNQQGGCMGIFSAVSLLNDKIAELGLLRTRLASAEEVVSMIEEHTAAPYLAKKTILLNQRARAHFEKFKEIEK